MSAIGWNQRFLSSTRGQVVALLRQGHSTVEELARALGLTDNAVRAHLASLERDGLVVQSGLRRGMRKPAYAYALTPDAERLFPMHSPTIASVELVRRGRVRRAKLYYLRALSGKAARIREKREG